MATSVKPIPDGASVVIPRLVCQDVVAAIEFCTHTFGAVERVRRPGPDGAAGHALLTIGPAMIMIEAEWPTLPSRVPRPDGSSPVVIYVYVEDVDATVARAIAGGAQVLFPVQNQFWGQDRVDHGPVRPRVDGGDASRRDHGTREGQPLGRHPRCGG